MINKIIIFMLITNKRIALFYFLKLPKNNLWTAAISWIYLHVLVEY
jgi:hypothetical protein